MKTIIFVISLFFAGAANADSAFDNFMDGLANVSDNVQTVASDTIEITQHTVIRGAAALERATGEMHQRLWSEMQDAQKTMSGEIGKIQSQVNYLQKRINNHIYKDREEHAKLQAQINAMQLEIAKLKKGK